MEDWKEKTVDGILGDLKTGKLSSPHDLGQVLEEQLPHLPEQVRLQQVEELLRTYSSESKAVRCNIMYALETTRPSFRNPNLRRVLYGKVRNIIDYERDYHPREFGQRVLRTQEE